MADLFGYEKPPAQTMGGIMVDGINKDNRHPEDFYPTEPEAVHALMAFIGDAIEGWSVMTGKPIAFHEPACGDGAIAKVIEGYGYPCLATDLVYRGYGTGGVDYLTSTETRRFVITNPPFNMAREFVEKALADGAERVWMLLKATYFHAASRVDLFEGTPISRIMPMSWRLDFTGRGRPTMECSWFEWQRGYKGEPVYGPILRNPRLDKKNTEICKNTVDLFE